MAKRKLSKQQKNRLHTKQQQYVHQDNLKQGQIIAHFGRKTLVEENHSLTHYRCHLRANLGQLVTGDKVVFSLDNHNQGVIEAVLARTSLLSRPNSQQVLKPIAANIDLVFIVLAVKPEPHAELIDRYLVAAEVAGLTPIIVLNKADLLEPDSALIPMLESFAKLGYHCLKICAHSAENFTQLQALLKDKVSVFVGQSGVGKSSIINRLLPEQELKIGALSAGADKGKHTTTSARLYHFPSGGDLIDSPGIREFGLWHMQPEEVLQGFIELKALAHTCQFRNCQHQKEPNCAIKHALEQGDIQPRRFASYQQIIMALKDVK